MLDIITFCFYFTAHQNSFDKSQKHAVVQSKCTKISGKIAIVRA